MHPLVRNLLLISVVALVVGGLTFYSIKYKPSSQPGVSRPGNSALSHGSTNSPSGSSMDVAALHQPTMSVAIGQKMVVDGTADPVLRLSLKGDFPKVLQHVKPGTTATITAIGPSPLSRIPQNERMFQVKLADGRSGWLPLYLLQPVGEKK